MTNLPKKYRALVALIIAAIVGTFAVGPTRVVRAADTALSAVIAGGLYNATTSTGGFLTAVDKTKLNGIESGAQVTNFARVSTALGAATAAVGFNAQEIQNIGTPTVNTSAIDGLTLNNHIIRVAARSSAAFPSYTYANGTGGQGATITGNTNAACPAIDGYTLTVGTAGLNSVLFLHGASQADNGIYNETQNGDGSTIPCVFTRSTIADTGAKVLGSKVRVRFGLQFAGTEWEYNNPTAPVIGTDVEWWTPTSPNVPTNVAFDVTDEFTMAVGTVTTAVSSLLSGPMAFYCALTGAASQCTPTGNSSHTEMGVMGLQTGTTTTGSAVIEAGSGGGPLVTYAVADEFLISMRLRVPVLSDGTNTYRVVAGIGNPATVAATEGLFFDYQQSAQTTWECTSRHASTSTQATGPTVTANQWYRFDIYKAAGSSTVHEYVDGSECGSGFSTNMPLATGITPFVAITKSASITSRTLEIDSYRLRYVWAGSRAL